MVSVSPTVLIKDPMPPEPANDIYRLVLLGEILGCMTSNVFYYQSNLAVGTATQETQIALRDIWGGAQGVFLKYLPCCANEWSTTFSLIDVPTTPGLATLVTPVGTAPGSGGAGALPNQCCVTLTKTSQWRGKHGRGRISVPAIPRANVTGTTLQNSSPYRALADAMQVDIADATFTFKPGILSVLRDKQTKEFIRYGWVVSHIVDVMETLGTCRRRKPGVGK